MQNGDYICLNGEYHKTSGPVIFSDNRGFRYGDSLVERIHAWSTEPQFLGNHLTRLKDNMSLIGMNIPGFFNEPNIKQFIVHLLNKNKTFKGAEIRLTVFRNPEETFIPFQNGTSFILESFALLHDKYYLNDKGLTVDISECYRKPTGSLSHLHGANPMLYLLTGMECTGRNLDSLILLNEHGRMTETFNANIFLVSGNALFTPAIDQGCIPGIMRSVVLEIAVKAGFRINDLSSLTPSALDDAEEVFLTNSIDGIRWVGAYRQKRYFSKTSRMLTARLNERAFGEKA